MDIVYLIVAGVVLGVGAWIAHSGLRRWQHRHQPTTAKIEAQTSPYTDFRFRPQVETLIGLLMIAWALRIVVLFIVQVASSKPAEVVQNVSTGRIELPNSSTSTAPGSLAANKAQ